MRMECQGATRSSPEVGDVPVVLRVKRKRTDDPAEALGRWAMPNYIACDMCISRTIDYLW